jgi:hypothetical protein
MNRLRRREERLLRRLSATGSRRGTSPASRFVDVLRRPWTWAGFALALSLAGPRGRRAALRAIACSATATAIHLPLSVATLGSHWSLIRSRQHYPSDVLGGGAIAIAVAGLAWRLRPPGGAPVRGPGARQAG